MQDYRKLKVWQRSHANVLAIREVVNRFPRRGYASLKAQIQASAESIPYNIVEGSGANSQKEFARFLEISIKSAGEAEYQLELAKDYGVVGKAIAEKLQAETIEIRKMLIVLRKKVLESS
jgi:four helix bundle protein